MAAAPYTDHDGITPDLLVWNKSDLAGFQKRDGFGTVAEKRRRLARIDCGAHRAGGRKAGNKRAKRLPSPGRAIAMRLTEALATLAPCSCGAADQPELFAEDLRLAMRAIGRITGQVDVEELLDSVFRDFCIGK